MSTPTNPPGWASKPNAEHLLNDTACQIGPASGPFVVAADRMVEDAPAGWRWSTRYRWAYFSGRKECFRHGPEDDGENPIAMAWWLPNGQRPYREQYLFEHFPDFRWGDWVLERVEPS